ncbi:hypothetical protein DTO164E3_9035 [Paecilomyces variotii]|nr:hypothetical protein DTO164E3_9035 [Paecilomyces variotii]
MDRGHSQWGAPQPRSIGSTAYLLPTATQEPGISPRSDAACAAPPITARVCAVAGSTLYGPQTNLDAITEMPTWDAAPPPPQTLGARDLDLSFHAPLDKVLNNCRTTS